MSRPQSSRQTTINNALVRPRPSDLNQLASAKPGALQTLDWNSPYQTFRQFMRDIQQAKTATIH